MICARLEAGHLAFEFAESLAERVLLRHADAGQLHDRVPLLDELLLPLGLGFDLALHGDKKLD